MPDELTILRDHANALATTLLTIEREQRILRKHHTDVRAQLDACAHRCVTLARQQGEQSMKDENTPKRYLTDPYATGVNDLEDIIRRFRVMTDPDTAVLPNDLREACLKLQRTVGRLLRDLSHRSLALREAAEALPATYVCETP